METPVRFLLLLLGLFLTSFPLVSCGAGLISSSIQCENEGMAVDVPYPCISCKCQNKEVVCHKDFPSCPTNKSCYLLSYGHEKKACCDILCKGCSYKGQNYQNEQEWNYPENPCIQLSCQGGIVTETNIKCHTSCRNPEPPPFGTCCPVCPGCKSDEGIEVKEGIFQAMPSTDPCVTCMCTNSTTVCSKKACPVLPCPPGKQRLKPGSCCPECTGTRRMYKVDNRCRLSMRILKDGEELQQDPCTTCKCNNSTSYCQRITCPPLDCRPELQLKTSGKCCPECRGPEEIKAACMVHGKLYQDGDRWKIEKCTRCECKNGQVQCAVDPCKQIVSCPLRHTLKTLPGACCPQCVEDDGVCAVFGDPHYKTFDGHMFNFQGACKYILAKDCTSKSFSIEVLNDSRYSKAFSWTKSVTIKVNGTKVRLGQNMKIHVNHKPVKLPYVQLGVLSVFQEDFNVLVRTNIGIKVFWDGNSFLEVSAPSNFKNHLCGLCGNYNDKREDDFQLKKGKLAATAEEFGNSWKVGRMKRCKLAQPAQSESICQKNWDVRIKAIKDCNVLKSATFRSCHRVVSAVPYYRSCLLDVCECRSRDKCYCESLAAYSRECARAGAKLEWRNATGCDGGRCSNGERFMTCAPACRRTCKKPTRDKSCRRPCRPDCYCPPGTVWHKRHCIPLDECPA